jgi:hypothetical protein
LSKVQVDTIDTRSGTSTMQIGSTNTSTINLGVSGDTINIPSGVTIANAGTATGFGFTPYGASAYSNAAQSIPTGTNTKVLLPNEYTDTNGEFASSTYTVGTAGNYLVSAQIYENGETGSNVVWQVYIYKNGSLFLRGSQTTDYAVGYTFSISSVVVPLAASDTIELYVFHNKGSNASINFDNTGTFLNVLRVR